MAHVMKAALLLLLSRYLITIEGSSDFIVKVPPNQHSWRLSFASCHDFPGNYVDDENVEVGTATLGIPFNWKLIADRNPDAFIWGGDIIYGDFPKRMEWLPFPLNVFLSNIPIKNIPFVPATPEKLSHMYTALKEDEGYKALYNQLGGKGSTRHFGTWDDHDFGLNDADKTLSIRKESKDAFLNFFDASYDDPRRSRTGVYSSTLFLQEDDIIHDEHSEIESNSVLVIALDLRYEKDPYDDLNDFNGDFLGEEQWKWLENTLKTSKARSHVFISSLQMLVEGREPISECWSDFPLQRQRFFKLLTDLKVKAPLIVSGDVHFAELWLLSVVTLL